jgi:hypothetical protein
LREICPFKKITPKVGRNITAIAGKLLRDISPSKMGLSAPYFDTAQALSGISPGPFVWAQRTVSYARSYLKIATTVWFGERQKMMHSMLILSNLVYGLYARPKLWKSTITIKKKELHNAWKTFWQYWVLGKATSKITDKIF